MKKLKNCPECKYWWFDRMKDGCKKGHELTYTTLDICELSTFHPFNRECKDYENIRRSNHGSKNET